MSSLDELSSTSLTKFPGWQSRLDEEDSSQVGALLALNCDYLEGQVLTRTGWGPILVTDLTEWNANQTIQHLFNWLPYTANWLIRFHSLDEIIARNLLDNGGVGLDMWVLLTGLSASSVNGISCSEQGSRLYIAFFNSNGFGARQAVAWDGSDTSAVPNVEKLFQGPFLDTELTITATPAALIPGDGEVPLTAGIHHVAFVFTTKNGHEAGISPVTSDSVIVPFVLDADGVSAYSVTVTPTSLWPSWVDECRIVITTTSNLARYFLMANINFATLISGTVTPATFRIWGTDDDLATFTEVTNLQDSFMQDPGGSGGGGPFNPHYLDAGGMNRLAYAATLPDLYLNFISVVYVSDPNAPQSITADQHAIRLPGQRRVTTIRWLGKSLYMFGRNYTYASLDNGDLPILWPPPELIDGNLGSPFPHGISTNASLGYLWVGTESGLCLLRGGSYNVVPISHFYGASDWDRINWAAPANAFQVIEDPIARKVIVRAPLKESADDNPQYSTHLLTWDYSQVGSGIEGVNHTNVFYSRDDLHDLSSVDYKLGHLELVQHFNRKRRELWVGRAETAGKVMRKKFYPADAVVDLYKDDGSAGDDTEGTGIDWQYRTPPLKMKGQVDSFVAADIRAKGAGELTVAANTLDAAVTQPLSPITLSTAPGRSYLRWFPLGINSPTITYTFTNGAVRNAYAVISFVKTYYKRFVTHMLE